MPATCVSTARRRASERLAELWAFTEYMHAHAREQGVPFDAERAHRTAPTRARNKIAVAGALTPAPITAPAVHPPAAARERRERPRARRTAGSRDGPDEPGDPEPPGAGVPRGRTRRGHPRHISEVLADVLPTLRRPS